MYLDYESPNTSMVHPYGNNWLVTTLFITRLLQAWLTTLKGLATCGI